MVAEEEKAKKSIPDFRSGDTLRVHIKVVEGDSERVQAFEGTCLSRRGRGDSESFTVRKMSFGVGVERTFPLISPFIEKIEVVKSGKVRRAKLYYLRGLTGRAARLNEAESHVQNEAAEAHVAPPAKPQAGDGGKSSPAKHLSAAPASIGAVSSVSPSK